MKRRKTSVRERSKTPVVEEGQECKGWSPQLERLLRTIQDDEYQTRIIQVYLKTTDYNRTAVEMPMILANLHLAALDGFLASSGYKIAGAIIRRSSTARTAFDATAGFCRKPGAIDVFGCKATFVWTFVCFFIIDPHGRAELA